MTPNTSRIVIIGGGMVGLTFAALMTETVDDICIINKQPLRVAQQSKSARVSAIHLAAQHLLEKMHVWQQLPTSDQGIVEHMHVWESHQTTGIDFDKPSGENRLATIVDNQALIDTLLQQLQKNPKVHLLAPHQPTSLKIEKESVILTLEDGQALETPLVVGADGGQSWLREQMGVSVVEKPYHQKAVVAILQTEKPHRNTAFQVFLKGGPLAFLPMAHTHDSALVWSLPTTEADALLQHSPEIIAEKIAMASEKKLGRVNLLTAAQAIPLIAKDCRRYVQPHCVLIGDAAHTIHPLAGQGVNLGLMDALSLSQHLKTASDKRANLGAIRYLRAYERERAQANRQMMQLMTLLQTVFTSELPGLPTARRIGLELLNQCDSLKRCLIRYASL